MSIEKKSLISTLKTTKKANAVSSAAPEASHKMSKSLPKNRASKSLASKSLASKSLASKSLASKSLASKSLASKSLASKLVRA